MALVVQKFGGTSVADPQKIVAAAKKAIARQQGGHQVVVVVSAMGHQTDVLVDLAKAITDRPSAREMDMLLSTGEQVSVALFAMAIQSLGHKAVSLTGAQSGIRTDSTHTKARIRSITTDHVKKLLAEGSIVIAAGFQGIDQDGNITTLGRGGSDTTAVALAAGRAAGLQISEAEAIRWITANPAKALGVLDQTGTLEPGKRADIVIWDRDPFSVYARTEKVFIDGALTWDRRDPRYQPRSDFDLGQPGEGVR